MLKHANNQNKEIENYTLLDQRKVESVSAVRCIRIRVGTWNKGFSDICVEWPVAYEHCVCWVLSQIIMCV